MTLGDRMAQDWIEEKIKEGQRENVKGYGPMWPSVWIKPDADPERGWWVTLAFDGEDEAQWLCKFPSWAKELAAVWREDIERIRQGGTEFYTCPECLGDWISQRCEVCHDQGCLDQEGLSIYPRAK